MDFHDGITCQRFELEGWDLVQCLLDRSLCRDMDLDPRIPPLFFQYHYEMMFWPIRMSIFDL